MKEKFIILAGILLGSFMLAAIVQAQNKPTQKVMPKVIGMTCQQAQDAVKKAGLTLVGFGTTPTKDQKLDQKVFAQQPDPGKPTSTASFNCYRFVQVLMPKVVGLSLEKADAELRKIGITKYTVEVTAVTQNPKEHKKVLHQAPDPGKPIDKVVLGCYQYKDIQTLPSSEQAPGFGALEGKVVPPGGDPNLQGNEGFAAPKLTPRKK